MQTGTVWVIVGYLVIAGGLLFGSLIVKHGDKLNQNVSDRLKDEQAQQREVRLTEKIDTLQTKLQPFEKLANKMYPKIETDAALGKLYKELQDVKEKTQRLSPREITPEQNQVLIKLLRSPTLSKFPIMIAVRMMDSESQQFGERLRKVFAEAEWDVKPLNKSFLDDVTGDFAINITDATQDSTAKQLASILNQVGFKCMLEHVRPESMAGAGGIAGHIYIFVGSKK